jgi:putative transposase
MSYGGYKIRNREGIYFITFAVVEWVDVFTRIEYKNILINSLTYCQKEKGLIIYCWCIMSNHIHLIVSAKENNLSDILRDFKKFTAKEIIKAIVNHPGESRKEWMLTIFKQEGLKNSRNVIYQLWRQDNQPKELFSSGFSNQKLVYIHNNPVEAGIVEKADDYLYSSAKDYHTGKNIGILKIEFLV